MRMEEEPFSYLIYLPFLTAGIPLLIMEFTLGHKYRGSAPLSYARLNKKTEWIGWWQVAISFVISTYYAVIIAWAMAYTYFAVNQSWGEDTGGFLMAEYLKRVDIVSGGAPGDIGSLSARCIYSINFSVGRSLRGVI